MGQQDRPVIDYNHNTGERSRSYRVFLFEFWAWFGVTSYLVIYECYPHFHRWRTGHAMGGDVLGVLLFATLIWAIPSSVALILLRPWLRSHLAFTALGIAMGCLSVPFGVICLIAIS